MSQDKIWILDMHTLLNAFLIQMQIKYIYQRNRTVTNEEYLGVLL